MFLKPQYKDLKIIGFYLGKIIFGLGLVKIIPLIFGICLGEFNPALDFAIVSLISITISIFLMELCKTDQNLNWIQGMIVVSLSWLVAMFLAAIPLYLSGHFKSFLDTCFDTMSGYATTGLTLVQDLDHLSLTHNLWRHLIMFIGGQGIVIVALSFLVKGLSGAFRMYVGEARDERVLPNVIETARFIWIVSIVYLILGTIALGVCGILNGMKAFNSFFHGACIFMAAFDTGGFAPQSQNILYYHSFPFEVITIVIMILGSINFKLHYALWFGKKAEIWKNIEMRSFFFTIIISFLVVAIGLSRFGVYPQVLNLFRKGFYQLISGHTGTGFMTIYADQFANEWGALALTGITVAMGLGGAICSTTGGIKALRIGMLFKAIIKDVKRLMLPESAVVVDKFHHIREINLEEKVMRQALLVLLCYILLYFFGAFVGMFFGYPFLQSFFESTSAAANVGLSCGITRASMPSALKVTYIFQMWIGRLEFISVFAIAGFFVAWVKGKR